MSEFLSYCCRVAASQRAKAIQTYLAALHRPDDAPEPSDAETQAVIDAMRLLGISVREATSEASIMAERRKLESQLATSQADAEREGAELAEASKLQESLRGTPNDGSFDRASRRVMAAQSKMRHASQQQGFVEDRLKQLRVDCPRVFGVNAEPTIL